MASKFVLTFDNPILQEFDREISLGSESRPLARTAHIERVHTKYFQELHAIYQESGGQFDQIKKWLDLWTSTDENKQQQALQGFLNTLQNPGIPENISLTAWLATRQLRWQALAERLRILVPDAFCVYRFARLWRDGEFSGGKHALPKVFALIREVTDAWLSDSDKVLIARQKQLGSWSLSESGLQKHIAAARIGLKYKAEIPFDATFADKWVDDAAFLEFSSENEVIALREVGVKARDIQVVIDQEVFNYQQLDQLADVCVTKYDINLRT
jgi:hypothetical protein